MSFSVILDINRSSDNSAATRAQAACYPYYSGIYIRRLYFSVMVLCS